MTLLPRTQGQQNDEIVHAETLRKLLMKRLQVYTRERIDNIYYRYNIHMMNVVPFFNKN